jgi:hypothetical protein
MLAMKGWFHRTKQTAAAHLAMRPGSRDDPPLIILPFKSLLWRWIQAVERDGIGHENGD